MRMQVRTAKVTFQATERDPRDAEVYCAVDEELDSW